MPHRREYPRVRKMINFRFKTVAHTILAVKGFSRVVGCLTSARLVCDTSRLVQ